MMGTIIELFLLSVLLLVTVVCALAPVGFMGIVFWRWHRELAQLRQTRSGRPTAVPKTVPARPSAPSRSAKGAARLDRLAS